MLLLLWCAISAERASAQLWTYRSSGTTRNLRGVAFMNDSVGVIVGDFGTLLRTTDGGIAWTAAATGTSEHLRAVSLLPDGNGFIVGGGGIILHSTDGFLTWSQQASGTTAFLLSVDCFDPQNALASGVNGTILQTGSAGAVWQSRNAGTTISLRSVAYASATNAAAVGSFGLFAVTSDAGLSWSTPGLPYTYALNAVGYFDSANGMIFSDGGIGYKLYDGGVTVKSMSRLVAIAVRSGTDGVGVGSSLAITTDRGASWEYHYAPEPLEAAAYIDSTELFAVGLNGFVSSCLLSASASSAVELVSPPHGDSATSMILSETIQLGVEFRWRTYGEFNPSGLRLQLGSDSTFSSELHFDGSVSNGAINDTSSVLDFLTPHTRYFWRMRPEFGVRVGPWSETRTFTPSAGDREVTVAQVQHVSAESLAVADTLTLPSPPRTTLQTSAFRDSLRVLVGVCTAQLDELKTYKGGSFDSRDWAMIADTGGAGAPWTGMRLNNSWASTLVDDTMLWNLRLGDVVMLTGKIKEDPPGSPQTETTFDYYTMRVIDRARALPPPLPVSPGDLYVGKVPSGTPQYSTGEPLEGVLVELTGLSVYAIDDVVAGTVTLIDDAGNTVTTNDESRWFTMRPHRAPASTYAVPALGARIDTLRGFVRASQGRYRIMPVRPSDMVMGTARSGAISGVVFSDLNRNAILDPGEPPIPDWPVRIGGKVSTWLASDASGRYAISGLDSGAYEVSRQDKFGWAQSMPDTEAYALQLGIDDSSANNDFGLYFQWNTIEGTVYHDFNENGIRDSLDQGLQGRTVKLSGETTDSVLTEADGSYRFPYVKTGVHRVTLRPVPLWEETVPDYLRAYEVDLRDFDLHKTGYDFSVHPTPERVRLNVSVTNDIGTSRVIWFGVRPGATYGIWGADPLCSNFDYSEGEAEIPPISNGIFDVRFIDPDESPDHFGEGGWTDIRDFVSSAQADTYRVTFLPGYFFGGDYPMTFRWSHTWASLFYSGALRLVDRYGNETDMKLSDSLVVTDPTVDSLTIIAVGPNLTTDGVDESQRMPERFHLAQNYPNPFNPTTRFAVELPSASHVSLRIFDLLGREIATLVDEERQAGAFVATWDAAGVPSGVYFCRLNAGAFVQTQKILLIR